MLPCPLMSVSSELPAHTTHGFCCVGCHTCHPVVRRPNGGTPASRAQPHKPHPQNFYQLCSLSSCTNNDTSASQVLSSISKHLLDTVSMKSGGWRAPHPEAQHSSVQAALGDQSWCSQAVSQHTADSVGCSGSWIAVSHSAALLTQALALGHSPYSLDHGKPSLSHNQGLAEYLSSIVPWCVPPSQGPDRG